MMSPRTMIFVMIGVGMLVCMKFMPDMEELQKAQAQPNVQR